MIYNFEDLSFKPTEVERISHTKGLFYEPGRHFASLSFCLSGKGFFRTDNNVLSVKQGCVLFIPSATPYEVEYSSGESIRIRLDNCNYKEAEAFSFKNPNSVSLIFSGLLESWQESHSLNAAKSAVYSILEKLEENARTSLEENDPISSCLKYIEAHFCDPSLDIATVCRQGYMSVSSLQRAFMDKFEMSPMQYIIKLRMNKALSLLTDDRLSVKEIAFLCGFSDEKYFSRAFKKSFGYSPSQLRGNVIEYCYVNQCCHKA